MIGDNIQKTLKMFSELANVGMSDDFALKMESAKLNWFSKC